MAGTRRAGDPAIQPLGGAGGAADSLAFALGTFTRLPVPAPRQLDRRVAARGLVLAPLVGALIGLMSGWPLLLGGRSPAHATMSAVLALALSVWLTRGLHWDGLADTADGLGALGDAAHSLAVMRRSDIGPFGVMSLLLMAMLQVSALAVLPAGPSALAGWCAATAAGRWAIVVACGRWAHPARPDGLGALVIGAASAWQVAVSGALAVLVALAGWRAGPAPVAIMPAALVGAPVAMVVIRLLNRRIGGLTGDVLGATCELAATCALLVLAGS